MKSTYFILAMILILSFYLNNCAPLSSREEVFKDESGDIFSTLLKDEHQVFNSDNLEINLNLKDRLFSVKGSVETSKKIYFFEYDGKLVINSGSSFYAPGVNYWGTDTKSGIVIETPFAQKVKTFIMEQTNNFRSDVADLFDYVYLYTKSNSSEAPISQRVLSVPLICSGTSQFHIISSTKLSSFTPHQKEKFGNVFLRSSNEKRFIMATYSKNVIAQNAQLNPKLKKIFDQMKQTTLNYEDISSLGKIYCNEILDSLHSLNLGGQVRNVPTVLVNPLQARNKEAIRTEFYPATFFLFEKADHEEMILSKGSAGELKFKASNIEGVKK